MKTLKINIYDIKSSMRLNGNYHLSKGTLYLKRLREMPHKELGRLTSKMFTAGRKSRVYTNNKYGYPYLSNSDVIKQNPLDECKFNSKKYCFDESSFLKEGMIITGRVGAIASTTYITSEFESYEAMGSDNIIRIVPKNHNDSGYIYTFLISKYGKTLIWKLAAGGVQPYISENMLEDMPIPEISDLKKKQIQKLIDESSNYRVKANKIMNLVINQIEKDYSVQTSKKTYSTKFSKIIEGDKYTK